MTQTPPARYQFSSEAEFDAAMADWCRDFEPRYYANYYDEDAGAWTKVEATREEALAIIQARPGHGGTPAFMSACVADKFIDCPVLHRAEAPAGDGKQMRYNGDLPGGSRSDYRAAGYKII